MSKRWDVSLLIAYMFLLFALAVLKRMPGTEKRYEMRFLWSWQKPSQWLQIIANIIAFLSIGILGHKRFNWKVIMLGLGFSVLIETTQLLTYRGLFEFDDMMHNTLGTAIGYGIVAGVRKLK